MAGLDYRVAIQIALGGDDGVRKLSEYFRSLGKSAEEADRLAEGLSREVQGALNVIRAGGNPTAALTAHFKALGGSEKDAADLAKRLTAELRNYEKASKQAETASGKLGVSLQSIKSAAAQAAGALGVGFTVREFVQTAADVEKLRAGLTAVTGDAAKAKAEFEFVRGVAQKVGVDITTAGEAFLGMAAATRGTAVEGEPTRKVFEAVANAMAKAGKSSAETQRALLALSQIAGKGTVQMEELRGQLGEALPGALQAAAAGMGITTRDLIALVEQGRISAEDIFPALTKGLNDLYGTAPQAQTLSQEITGIRNAFVDMATAIADNGGLAALKTGAEIAQSAIVLLGDAIVSVGKTIGVLAGAVATLDFSGVTEAFAEIERESQTRLLNAAKNNEVLAGYINAVGSESTKAALAAQQQAAAQEQQAAAAAKAAGATEQQGKSLVQLTAQYPLLAQAIGSVEPAAAGAAKSVGAVSEKLDKLPVERLRELADQARTAFGDGAITAEQFATAMGRVADGSARAVGVDLGGYARGVSDEFERSLAALALFVGQLDALETKGVNTGAALVAAFDALAKKARNTTEVDELTFAVQRLGEAGRLSAEQVDAALSTLARRAAELTPGIQTVAEAFKTLGLTAPEQLRKTADEAERAFGVIRAGGASVNSLQAAAVAYAKAQVAAFGETSPQAERARAALESVGGSWDSVTGKSREAGNVGKAAFDKIKTSADEASKSIDGATESVIGYIGQLNKADGTLLPGSNRIVRPEGYQEQGSGGGGGGGGGSGGSGPGRPGSQRERTGISSQDNYDANGNRLNTAGQIVSAQGRTESQAASQRAQIIRDELGPLGLDASTAGAEEFARLTQQLRDYEARLDEGRRQVTNTSLKAGTPDASLAAEMQRLREEIGRLRFGFFSSAASGGSGGGGTRSITLNVGGRSTAVNFADDSSAQALIDALKRAGLVAA